MICNATTRHISSVVTKRAPPPTFDPKRKIGLLGVLEDRNSSFLVGPAQAPPLIRQYFHEPAVNTWCELGFDVAHQLCDYGDVTPQTRHPEGIEEATKDVLQRMLDNHHLPITLGGDHSITFSLVKSIQNHLRDAPPLVIVHFDAHPDIYPDYEGDKSSHACPFARILEVPGLCGQLISIGVRTISGPQMPLLDQYGVVTIEARHFPAKGSDIQGILEQFIQPTTPVYVSVDVDVLDPSAAPGVSHREGGGLTPRQLIDAIHCIPGIIVGADLVEYNPTRDTSDFLTASVVAKIMKELAGKALYSRRL